MIYAYAGIAALGAIIGSFLYGMNVGADRQLAAQAKADTRLEQVEERAFKGAIDAINKQRPIHKTIQTQAETVIREREIYKCPSDPVVERLLDTARQDGATAGGAGVSPGSGKGGSP